MNPTTLRISGLLRGLGITALASSLHAVGMAETITVDPTGGPADHASIGDAVAAAASGDVVLLAPGIYRDTDGDGFVVAITDKDLTIRSTDGAETTAIEYPVVDGDTPFGRGLYLVNETFGPLPRITVEGVTIRPDSSAEPGAGLSPRAALEARDMDVRFTDCRFESNRGENHIWAESGRFEFSIAFAGCAFEDNSDMQLLGVRGGFTDCSFSGCDRISGARSASGIVDWQAVLDFEGCSFTAQADSVRIFGTGRLDIRDCTFSESVGGPSVHVGFESAAFIHDSRFLGSRGTAVSINEAALQMIDCTLEGHPDSEHPLLDVLGDACEACGSEYTTEVFRTEFRSNPGGAVRIWSPNGSRMHRALVKSCRFIGNSSVDEGGAISISTSDLDIDRCTFTENRSSSDGHAIAMHGDDHGAVRVMNSTFTENGDGGAGDTVFNNGLDQVQVFGNGFCGDAGDPLGGSAMSVWDNLLVGACWADFPNPRGVTALQTSPSLEASTVAGPDRDSDVAVGGTGDTAFAESTFHSFPLQADASANATINDSTPTEHGIDHAIQTGGHVIANAGGDDFPIGADARVRFRSTTQVSTREALILEIDLFRLEGADPDSRWDSLTNAAEVRGPGGEVLVPTDVDAAGGHWRYELPADGNYSIDLSIECSSEAVSSGFGSVSKLMSEALRARIEFHLPGEDGDGDEEEEEEEEKTIPEDLNQDGRIDGADIAAILQFWGTADPSHDLNQDGVVDGGDFAMVLASWN